MKQLKAHDFPDVYKNLNIDLNKLGCVMLDIETLKNMQESNDIVLYTTKNEERFWIKGWVVGKTAHVTLLYGLLEPAKQYRPYINDVLNDWSIDEVEIDHIDYFDSPYSDEPYYCIIAHIKTTSKLTEGHERLEFLPHINTFTGYKPHMTICYIDKNQGEKYRDETIKRFNNLWKGKKLKVKPGINLGK